jgi:hypothetical protein
MTGAEESLDSVLSVVRLAAAGAGDAVVDCWFGADSAAGRVGAVGRGGVVGRDGAGTVGRGGAGRGGAGAVAVSFGAAATEGDGAGPAGASAVMGFLAAGAAWVGVERSPAVAVESCG